MQNKQASLLHLITCAHIPANKCSRHYKYQFRAITYDAHLKQIMVLMDNMLAYQSNVIILLISLLINASSSYGLQLQVEINKKK